MLEPLQMSPTTAQLSLTLRDIEDCAMEAQYEQSYLLLCLFYNYSYLYILSYLNTFCVSIL